VYWANCHESGAILKIAKSGGAVTTLASGLATPQAIAVDDRAVYWVESGSAAGGYTNGGVWAIAKTGGMRQQLAADNGQPHTLTADSTTIYWGGADAINGVSKFGGAVHRFAPATGVTTIAVDDTFIYWGEDRYIVGAINKVSKYGGDTVHLSDYLPVSMAVDFARIDWIDGAGDVFSMSKSGGSVTTLFSSSGGGGSTLTLDGTYAFWTTNDEVRRIPKVGGFKATLAASQPQPRGLAVDAFSVYFTTYGGGTIDRVSKLLTF
jgi:hypothetical protein